MFVLELFLLDGEFLLEDLVTYFFISVVQLWQESRVIHGFIPLRTSSTGRSKAPTYLWACTKVGAHVH